MAKLKIYTFPDAVLAKQAKPIERVERSYYTLADDMLETMYDAPGVGLAANQVGVLERILVIDTDYEIDDEAKGEDGNAGSEVGSVIRGKQPRIVINPEIIHAEGTILYKEGCLSIPEYCAEIKRHEKIKLQYLDIDGVSRTLMAEGLLAVAIQHEMDHLNGKLFIDRLSPLKEEMAQKKLRRERKLLEEELAQGYFPKEKKPKKEL